MRGAELEALARESTCASRSSAVRACASMPSRREMRAVACAIVVVGRARHALPGHRLDELVHREPARIARRAARGQHVVRAGGLVAEGDGGLLAEEERAVAGEVARATSRGPSRAPRGARRRSGRRPAPLPRGCRTGRPRRSRATPRRPRRARSRAAPRSAPARAASPPRRARAKS